MTLVLTDNAGIAPVNAACFGKNRPTDVITSPYRPLPGEDPGLSGEIFVNVERALEVAGRGAGLAEEIALYIAHGIDHLAGATDRTPPLRARMRRRERTWLKEARAAGAALRL